MHPTGDEWRFPIQALLSYQVQTLVARMPIEQDRPRIRLSIARPLISDWRDGTPSFLLHHVGGDPAHRIQVLPVKGLPGSSLQIEFSQVSSLDAQESDVLLPARLVSPASDGTSQTWKRFFETDCRGADCVSYPVRIQFQWAEQECEDRTNLLWAARNRTLSVHLIS